MKKLLIIASTIAALVAGTNAFAESIVNGGFETGSFSGWTQSGNQSFTSVSNGQYAHSGRYGAQLGPELTNGYLSQTFSTVVGDLYELSYWLSVGSSGGSTTPNDFSAAINGNALFSGVNLSAQGFKQYTYDFAANTPLTTLTFSFRHDPWYFGLDDVSVVDKGAVPEPTTVALLGLGLLGVAASRRKSSKK